MKRNITASTTIEEVTETFVELVHQKLHPGGYSVDYEGVLPNVKLTAYADGSDSNMMPKLDLKVSEYEPNVYEVIPTLSFPVLTTNSNDYADTIHYYLSQWEQLGRCITELNGFLFDADAYRE